MNDFLLCLRRFVARVNQDNASISTSPTSKENIQLLALCPPCWIQIWRQSRQDVMPLRLRLSPYAYANRTCKYYCASACVYVEINVNASVI